MSAEDDRLHAEDMIEAATLLEAEADRVASEPDPWPSGHVASLLLPAESTRLVAAILRTAVSHAPVYAEGGVEPHACRQCVGPGPCDVWETGRVLAEAVLEQHT